jgi:hypothetical protein
LSTTKAAPVIEQVGATCWDRPDQRIKPSPASTSSRLPLSPAVSVDWSIGTQVLSFTAAKVRAFTTQTVLIGKHFGIIAK